jgi:hypothetical protein
MTDYFGRTNTQFNGMYNTAYNGNFQPQMAQQPQPAPMRTNKIYVTSLEDALNRYAEPNTIMIYRNQDEKFEYEIITDGQGRKSYKTLELGSYSVSQEEKRVETPIISREEFEGVKGRLEALESEILKKYKEERRVEKKGGLE